jgi:hypothetical protein
VYKKGDKLDCKNYRGIWLLKVTNKVFAKILYNRLLPGRSALMNSVDELMNSVTVQHYQARFQSGKSTRDQLCTAPNLRKMQ